MRPPAPASLAADSKVSPRGARESIGLNSKSIGKSEQKCTIPLPGSADNRPSISTESFIEGYFGGAPVIARACPQSPNPSSKAYAYTRAPARFATLP